MRGIIYKDLCLFFKCLNVWVFLIGIGALVLLLAENGVYAGMLASFMVDMMVGALNVLVFEEEEKSEWGKYQRTLPVGCGKVVAGKYAAVLLTVLISLAASALLNLAVFAAHRTFLPAVLGLSMLLAAAIPVAWTAVSLPLCYWAGFRASQFSSAVCVFFLFFFVKNFEDSMWTVSDLMPGNGLVLWLAGLLALAGMFALSLAVSAAGYRRKK